MSHASRTQRIIVRFVILTGGLAFVYAGASIVLTMYLAYQPPLPIKETPAALGLKFRSVVFFSREDHVLLRGWFIPGLLPGGELTVERTIIFVHGMHVNRATPIDLSLGDALVHRGFAVLAFDLRGHGESAPAPMSGGYYEQQDVLGAVDFLRSGPLPYPELGHPRFIGGWGISLGGVALLFAAAREPALKALVIDSAYASMQTLIERSFGAAFPLIPGARLIARALYGFDYYTVRPVDVVGQIAPRPILFIHGVADVDVPPSDMALLVAAASASPGAHVQSWLVPGAHHIEAYPVSKSSYITRLADFFTAGLKP